MTRALVVPWLAVLLAGCSGMVIKPISPQEATAFHEDPAKNGRSGYVVYAPTIYFSVGLDDKNVCVMGKPFVLPDYNRPYRLDSKSGLGKAGTEFTITDGWMLGAAKDNSDNTAILNALTGKEGIFGLDQGGRAKTNCITGLYQMDPSSRTISRVELPLPTS